MDSSFIQRNKEYLLLDVGEDDRPAIAIVFAHLVTIKIFSKNKQNYIVKLATDKCTVFV